MEQVLSTSITVVTELVSMAWVELTMVAGATAGYALLQGGSLPVLRPRKDAVGEEPQPEPERVARGLHSSPVAGSQPASHRLWQRVNHFVQAQRGGAFIVVMDALCRAFQRRRVNGPEGDWASDFAATAAARHHVDVFDEAAGLLERLHPRGNAVGDTQVNVFVEAVLAQLRCFDAHCAKTREHALQLVERAEACDGLLPGGAEREMRAAFVTSIERARVKRSAQRSGLGPALRGRLASPAPAIGHRAGQRLALNALAALGSHHKGLNMEVADRAVVALSA